MDLGQPPGHHVVQQHRVSLFELQLFYLSGLLLKLLSSHLRVGFPHPEFVDPDLVEVYVFHLVSKKAFGSHSILTRGINTDREIVELLVDFFDEIGLLEF